MIPPEQVDIDELLKKIAADPLAAADELDRLAEQFHEAARILRLTPKPAGDDEGVVSVGALSDRVRMRVVGPDGVVKGEGGGG